ncbi:hypothetical protein Moror_809 [Moniliophthora roreri MCA 2997]|uniref:F-box domain-containing protein n=1 Tax=Moniliophthora roreri (strain MCA 2997) TaxID=1381753 RepID=V2YDW6_MONRO|nr:hypothetical protein Moror_809 [Moniliophthora roreri MCA 2997]
MGHRRCIRFSNSYTGKNSAVSIPFESHRELRMVRKNEGWRLMRRTKAINHANRCKLGDMPFDIIYTISKDLDPRTFIALLQVNKSLWSMLFSTEGESIWVPKRKQYGIPDPLPGLSEMEWALIVIGDGRCQSCYDGGDTTRNWILRPKLCGTCSDRRTISKDAIKEEYPMEIALLSKMNVNLSDILFGYQYWTYLSSGVNSYDPDDVEQVLKEFLACADSQARVLFLEKRAADLDGLREHVNRTGTWIMNEENRMKMERRNTRVRAIQKRVIRMGYSSWEASTVAQDFWDGAKLTRHEWRAIKGRVIQGVQALRRTYIAAKTPVYSERRRLVAQAYWEYRKGLLPPQWLALPSFETLCLFSGVSDMLIRPDSIQLTVDDFRIPIESVQVEVRSWMSDQRKEIVSLMSEYENKPIPILFGLRNIVHRLNGTRGLSLGIDRIEWSDDADKLAIILLECKQCGKRCTSADVTLRHLNSAVFGCKMRSNLAERGNWHFEFSATAVLLVHLSGLDFRTATADIMDERGDFFICETCAGSFTWRECITHECGSEHEQDTPRFQLLEGETRTLHDDRVCWTCSRCNSHMKSLVTRSTVKEHLPQEHGISSPRVPQDFAYAGPY